MKKIIIIALIVITIFTLPVLGWFGHARVQDRSYDQASAAAEKYIESIITGNLDAAYASSSQEFKDNQPQDVFVESFKTLKSDEPERGYASVLKSKEGRIVYVQMIDGMPKTPEGRTSAQFTITLSNDGGWKVSSVSVN